MKWDINNLTNRKYIEQVISQKKDGEIDVYRPLVNVRIDGQYDENLVLELNENKEIIKVVDYSLLERKYTAPIEKIELGRTDKNRYFKIHVNDEKIIVGRCYCCDYIIDYKSELLNEIRKKYNKNYWFGKGSCEELKKIDRNTYVLTRILGASHHDINPPERILYCYDRYNAIIIFKDKCNYEIKLNYVGLECN